MEPFGKTELFIDCFLVFLIPVQIVNTIRDIFTGDFGLGLVNASLGMIMCLMLMLDFHIYTDGGKKNDEFFEMDVWKFLWS
jgi:hypothetical protein